MLTEKRIGSGFQGHKSGVQAVMRNMLIAAVALFTVVEVATVAQSGNVIQDPNAYAVYAALLTVRSRNTDSPGKINLLQETRPARARTCADPERVPLDWEPVMQNFRDANRRTSLIKPATDLGVPYSLITPQMVQVIIATASKDTRINGPVFESGDRYRGLTNTYMAVSAVGFNMEKTLALLYTEDRCSLADRDTGIIQCMRGDMIKWEKVSGAWQPAKTGTGCGWIV